jgi:hypothetical protein
MRKSRMISLFALLALGSISLPVMAGNTPAVGASPRTSPIGKQLAELKASDSGAGDRFGSSVATSGTTVLVGAFAYANYEGRAYVFTKTASGWTQAAELKASDARAGDQFGFSVAISGTTAVVGAYSHAHDAGRAYVFSRTASGWTQAAELKGSDTAGGDLFGYSVGISGTTVVVGAYGHADTAGRAYVFTKTASGWKQAKELVGSDTVEYDAFGVSVAISGTTAIVGAVGHPSQIGQPSFAGRAYVFTKTASGWKQAVELKGSDTVTGDRFGISVAISGTTALVGAFYHASDEGRAYVFTKVATGWKQAKELVGSDTVAPDEFGDSVALTGATAVVGASEHAYAAGRAYLFTKTASGWKQAKELAGSDTAMYDAFGVSVAISGNTAVVSASGHSGGTGRAYVFEA